MRNCLITGCGRSGTSTVAGLFAHSGYFMGDRLRPGSAHNPRGFFEDAEVTDINEALLAPFVPVRPRLAGHSLPVPRNRPKEGQRWRLPVPESAVATADAALRERMSRLLARAPWCFKDTRFCYTAPAWQPLITDAAYVCVFREPGRTVASLQTMLSGQRDVGRLADTTLLMRVWHGSYSRVLAAREQGTPWLLVHHEQVLDGTALDRLASELQSEPDTRFVESRLRHSADPGAWPAPVARLYERMCVLAEHDLHG